MKQAVGSSSTAARREWLGTAGRLDDHDDHPGQGQQRERPDPFDRPADQPAALWWRSMRDLGSLSTLAALLLRAASLGCAWLGCSDEPGVARSPDEATERAIRGAIAFLSEPAHLEGHASYYLLHFLSRRFGLDEFADAHERYRDLTARRAKPASGVDVFERLIDPSAPPPTRLAVNKVDRFTTLALYCDRIPVAEDYEAQMDQLASEGGYKLTHVALATVWLEENGCPSPPAELRERITGSLAAGVNTDDRLDDLEIESAAFLHYLGRGDLVPSGFPGVLLRAQNPDGGWATLRPDPLGWGSNWHPTALALWILLESEGQGNGAPMIPRASAGAGHP
jgi:hypothetical protein